jgi:excisionase family DNA binding protein
MADLKDIMTPKQVAEYLQVHVLTVYRYIQEGKLSASRPGGRFYRIKRESVEKLLAETAPQQKEPHG